jgi:crotonobetainyl-CoA:carnitine CoA-transferase CaiB-like acyl-CoA transferase
MSGILHGIRVLDFGRYIAGPFCATMLGDMGAEVIRVERVEGSEDRFLGSVIASGEGGTYLQLARNKRGLTLDPMKPESAEIKRRLVQSADVVVANLPYGTLEAMGIDYETLKAIRPDIVLTHVSAFGNTGPYKDRVGFDLLGQAMSGMMYLTGQPGAPVRSQVPYVDFSTALFAAFGTLAALMERRQSGQGQLVEASLLHSAVALNNNFLVEEAVLGLDRQPRGNPGHHHAPNDVYPTRDGAIVTMIVGNPLFKRWARLLGEEEPWLTDARYATDLSRGDHYREISARMGAWCAERTTEEAIAALEQARIPAGPVYKPAQVLADPHIRARGMLKGVDFPGLPTPAPIADTPVKLHRTPGGIRERAPTLGEHTDAVLGALGFSAEEIADFRAAKVV